MLKNRGETDYIHLLVATDQQSNLQSYLKQEVYLLICSFQFIIMSVLSNG